MKLIKLTQGYFAQVDDEDYERINAHKWYVNITSSGAPGAAVRETSRLKGPRRTILMHSEILDICKPIIHLDLNRLNNRKSNLKVADFNLIAQTAPNN